MLKKIPLFLLVASAPGCATDVAPPPHAESVRTLHLADLGALEASLDRLQEAARSAPLETAPLQSAFREARLDYKRVEALVELYTPGTAEAMNGPAIPEVEEDDPNRIVLEATGFQVLEEMLFPTVRAEESAAIRNEITGLRANTRRLRAHAEAIRFTDAHVFEAARQEIARVVVLGLAGFDSPVALHSLPEAASALQGVEEALAPYTEELRARDAEGADALHGALGRAIATLRAARDFDGFDRLAFVTEHANPTARALSAARDALGIPPLEGRYPWRATAATLWDADAFDAHAFAPGTALPSTPERVDLGRLLFFEPALSGSDDRSCAFCHQPERGFTDGLPGSPARGAGGDRLRNAPTVINAALQASLFHDGRTAFLEDQVAEVVTDPREMGGDLHVAAARLRRSPDYAARFAAAFDAPAGGDAVSEGTIRAALAAYIRSLDRRGSRFDRYVRGEREALGAAERRGFNLFMGKAKCGTCHFAPLFNGTVPPAYQEAEVEVLGTPEQPEGTRVAPDVGRYALYRIEIHRHAFRTPTVRNVAVTAPYMHNGVFRTLEEVVEFYDAGGAAGKGELLENQTLPPDSLHLTEGEKRALIAFMEALTDTTGTTARPEIPARTRP